jgi:hypothetical protein
MKVESYGRAVELVPRAAFSTLTTVTYGPVVDISDLRFGAVIVRSYALAATPTLTSWLVGLLDPTANALDLAFDRYLVCSATSTAGTLSGSAARNHVPMTSAPAVNAHFYNILPTPYVRLGYYLSGAGASITFEAILVGK